MNTLDKGTIDMCVQQEIGVIGMGVMGRNLALNIESKGYCVSIYNRSKNKINSIISDYPDKNLIPYFSIKNFVFSLKRPRCIFLMITAGVYIDHIIKVLSRYLEPGDIIIDGGNSFYKDTIRRHDVLWSKKEVNFVGLGISGGEEGALKGPSLMPGCSRKVYDIIFPILSKIAARIDNDICVRYIGPNGAGHYVKMIHNGIEYGDMQLIAEIYSFLKNIFGLTYTQLGEIFKEWNKGVLNSYLIDITSRIFLTCDDNNNDCCILDVILDSAKNKGTGAWSSENALELGSPLSIITESVFARYLSTLKDQRLQASNVFSGPGNDILLSSSVKKIEDFIESARCALYFSKIILYAQGFYQLKVGSDKYNWFLNCKDIAKIFRAGCIIRSSFLEKVIDIYSETPRIENLLLASYCVDIANNYQKMLRDTVLYGIQNGVPMPAFSAAISYFDGYRSAVLPANLIQAQRDYFGSHTYERIDKEGTFHTEWLLSTKYSDC